MNSEFQIIRWGIPGWLFFLTVLVFKLTEKGFSIISMANSFSSPGVLAGLTALFVASGVPIGYIIYQIYFAFKWTIMKRKTVMRAVEDIEGFKGAGGSEQGLELWNKVEMHFDKMMSIDTEKKQVSYKDLVRRYEYFSNRTSRIHGLGASTLAMTSGFLFFFLTMNNRASLLDNGTFLTVFSVFLLCLGSVVYNYFLQNKISFVQLNEIMKTILEAEDKKEEKKKKEDEGDED
ncbi:hypothetical protein [Domibacillus sp.]|uniref:hypothetical protein n=1 Tax=Domibacillus sp. TaxID=1969783 RepID=UPI002810E698|nr:hypothetical protein [Domibacillus sp.]